MASRRKAAPRSVSKQSQSGWRGTVDSLGGVTTIAGVLVVALVVAALIWTTWPASGGLGTEPFVPRTHAEASGRVLGKPAAPVRIIEFGDYQCPFCRDFWRDVEPALMREFVDTGIASFEFRDFIVVGVESRTAAQGAACAAAQDFFWPMHDVLYLRQGPRENAGVYSIERVKQFAREAAAVAPPESFDVEAFDRCLEGGGQRAVVESMHAEAAAAGVNSTPTLMINGRFVRGAPTLDALRAEITAAQQKH